MAETAIVVQKAYDWKRLDSSQGGEVSKVLPVLRWPCALPGVGIPGETRALGRKARVQHRESDRAPP